jgi:carboxymethylenebutenolidase
MFVLLCRSSEVSNDYLKISNNEPKRPKGRETRRRTMSSSKKAPKKFEEGKISRREFVQTSLGTGFALAVLPITSWAFTTPDSGLVTGTVTIPTKGGKMKAYRAMPRGKGPFPTVLVVHEIFGVHAYIQDVCRRLALQGYMAISPDLYFRRGDATKLKDIQEIISSIVSQTPTEQVISDLDATVAWVKKEKKGNLDKMAITGFCWGGRITWMYAAHNPSLKAAIAWYGPLAGESSPTTPKHPIDVAGDLKVPVLGLYAGKDERISQADVEKMRTALKTGASKSEIIVFPEADHGFHADYRPSYNEAAAKEGWEKLVQWLKQNGINN